METQAMEQWGAMAQWRSDSQSGAVWEMCCGNFDFDGAAEI